VILLCKEGLAFILLAVSQRLGHRDATAKTHAQVANQQEEYGSSSFAKAVE
jgi:hypothetical protein